MKIDVRYANKRSTSHTNALDNAGDSSVNFTTLKIFSLSLLINKKTVKILIYLLRTLLKTKGENTNIRVGNKNEL